MSAIQLVINGIDESQDDVFRTVIKAAQDITHETHYDVEIVYDNEKIIETYIDWIWEEQKYDVMTHYIHPRFTRYMLDDEV